MEIGARFVLIMTEHRGIYFCYFRIFVQPGLRTRITAVLSDSQVHTIRGSMPNTNSSCVICSMHAQIIWPWNITAHRWGEVYFSGCHSTPLNMDDSITNFCKTKTNPSVWRWIQMLQSMRYAAKLLKTTERLVNYRHININVSPIAFALINNVSVLKIFNYIWFMVEQFIKKACDKKNINITRCRKYKLIYRPNEHFNGL